MHQFKNESANEANHASPGIPNLSSDGEAKEWLC
jgi:hypothetical protein